MDRNEIDNVMQEYVKNEELSGAALLVRKGNKEVFRGKWGYKKTESKEQIEFDSIYRMMSMTKCVTAVAVMICIEQGLMELDTPVSQFIPEFKNMQVMKDKRYEYRESSLRKLPLMLVTFSMRRVKHEPADREITIRDLLSHSSGLQQGIAGLLAMIKEKKQYQTLREFVLHYSEHILDFQPGSGTGYSPVAGFDILAYIVSLVAGMSFEEFMNKEICVPLDMKDTTFFLSDDQKKRLVDVYKRKKEHLVNVTGTKQDMTGILRQKELLFEHGCGGLFSTVEDYEHFGEMLLNQGTYHGRQILKPESVRTLHTEAPKLHLEPEPGFVWGLGMKIRKEPERGNSFATAGTYGWSGAFGTHFFISPKDELEVVFVTNRTDLNGSGSYISKKVEELVFEIWGKEMA